MYQQFEFLGLHLRTSENIDFVLYRLVPMDYAELQKKSDKMSFYGCSSVGACSQLVRLTGTTNSSPWQLAGDQTTGKGASIDIVDKRVS